MRLRRPQASLIDLARGPGRLTEAMGIGLEHYGLDLCAAGPLWLGDAVWPAGEIGTSIRIGISRETERWLRFYERGSPYVSGPRRLGAWGIVRTPAARKKKYLTPLSSLGYLARVDTSS